MKKILTNNGKPLVKDGKVFLSDGIGGGNASIIKPGGWSGTTVPTSGMVENVYFNTALSVDEVVNILSKLTYDIYEDGDPDEYRILTNDNYYLVVWRTNGAYVILNSTDYSIYFSSGANEDGQILGWDNSLLSKGYLEINSEVSNEINGKDIGSQNAQLSSLFSITPFVQASGESIGLSGNYDGSSIEVTEAGKVDIKALIDEKKIPLEVNVNVSGGSSVIDVEEFPTENVQDLTFYRKKSKTDTEVYMSMDGESMNLSTTATFYEVDEQPTETNMEVSNMETGPLIIYIFNGVCYLYTDLGSGLNVITLGSIYGMEDKTAGSVNDIDSDGIYVIYGKEIEEIGVNKETYNFIDGVWVDNNKTLTGLLNGTIGIINLSSSKVIRSFFFAGCRSLTKVYCPLVTDIGEQAFQSCVLLTDLYLGANQVVSTFNNAFNEVNNATVHVRAELLSEYQNNNIWQQFVSNSYITLVGDYTD